MSVVGEPAPERTVPAPERSGPSGPAAAALGLGALGVLGAAAQLADGAAPALPWVAVALLTAAGLLLAVPRAGAGGRCGARVLAATVLTAAVAGIAEHHLAPGTTGLDTAWYGDGGAPLAPGLLGQAAVLVLLATARRRRR